MKRILLWAVALLVMVFLAKKGWNYYEVELSYKTVRLRSLEKINEKSNVFVGDSHIAFFPLTEWFDDANVLNNGIGGNRSRSVLKRISAIAAYHPKSIFLEIGINDLLSPRVTDPEARLLDNYEKILDTVKLISPQTRVYVHSLLPINQDCTRNDIDSITNIILRVNTKLEALAKDKGCTYIDIFPLVASDNKLPFYYTYDGLHLNRIAYHKWFNEIKGYVKPE